MSSPPAPAARETQTTRVGTAADATTSKKPVVGARRIAYTRRGEARVDRYSPCDVAQVQNR